MAFSEKKYFQIGALIWLVIASGSCYSLGLGWASFNLGEKIAKIGFICLYLASFYLFAWYVRKMNFDPALSNIDADEVIKDFESEKERKLEKDKKKRKVYK